MQRPSGRIGSVMLTSGASHPRRTDFAARVGSEWMLKVFGTTAFVVVFFVGYFVLLRHPLFSSTVIPLTALDRWIPLQSDMVWVYLSLWFYVSIPATMLRTRPQLFAYGWLAGILAVVGLGIFFFWPTSTPPTAEIDWANYPRLAWLKGVDAAQNACPSLHVAFAMFSGIWLDRVLRALGWPLVVRLLNAVWCVAIVYSTMATRQHVAVDAYAGMALGLLAAYPWPKVLKDL